VSRGRPKYASGIYDVNMTPLIDVSLVLVVILMVATPMALQSSITVQNAAASQAAVESTPKPQRVEIEIVTEDSLLVNRAPVARSELRSALRALLTGKGEVIVRCAGRVTHGTVVGVLDEAKQCGAAQIAVLGR
jgi:biopolymer transport protein ExbD